MLSETAEKEVQDTSWWGYGGVPQLYKFPKIGGFRGLIKAISAFSKYEKDTNKNRRFHLEVLL